MAAEGMQRGLFCREQLWPDVQHVTQAELELGWVRANPSQAWVSLTIRLTCEISSLVVTRTKNKGRSPVGSSTCLTDETPQHTPEFQKMERLEGRGIVFSIIT